MIKAGSSVRNSLEFMFEGPPGVSNKVNTGVWENVSVLNLLDSLFSRAIKTYNERSHGHISPVEHPKRPRSKPTITFLSRDGQDLSF